MTTLVTRCARNRGGVTMLKPGELFVRYERRFSCTRKASYVVVVSILSALVCYAVASATPQSGRSWLNGFVFADSDTQGLAGATVQLIGDQDNARLRNVKLVAKAEEDGKYALKDVPYGEYTFRASAQGFKSYEIHLYVASDMLTQIHVRLKKE